MRKKAEALLGSTLTWIVAFVIIASLVFVFDVIAVSLTKNKTLAISYDYEKTNVISALTLQSILDTPIIYENTQKTILEVIKLRAKDKNADKILTAAIKNILEKKPDKKSHYFFYTSYISNNKFYPLYIKDNNFPGVNDYDFAKSKGGLVFADAEISLYLYEEE